MLKKSLAMLLAICMLFGVAACGKTTEADKNGSQTKTEAVQSTDASHSEAESSTVKVNAELGGDEPICGGEFTTQKYRLHYYSVPQPFVDLVDNDEFWEWDHANSETLY